MLYLSRRQSKVIVIEILVIIAIILFSNINFFALPNQDLFQYIADGQRYLNFQLPSHIQAPPANPILISAISRFFSHPHSEIISATSINIFSSLVTAYLVWKIGYKLFPSYAMFFFLLLVTNPVFYFVSLQPTSEALFSLFILLTLLSRVNRYPNLSLAIASASYLIRYEGVLLVGSLLLFDWIGKTPYKTKKSVVFFSVLFIVCWSYLVFHTNETNSISSNAFIKELVMRQQEIFKPIKITEYPKLFFQNPDLNQKVFLVVFYSLFLFSIIQSLIQRDMVLIMTTFSTFYLITHFLFPAVDNRYVFPVMPLVYIFFLVNIMKLCRQLSFSRLNLIQNKYFYQVLVLILIIFIISSNILNIYWHLYHQQDVGKEYIMISNWLNTQQFSHQIVFITLEPWILDYFVDNDQVTFYQQLQDLNTNQNKSLEDVLNDVQQKFPETEIFIENNNYTATTNSSLAQMFGLRFFREISSSPNLTLVKHLYNNRNWALIYRYE